MGDDVARREERALERVSDADRERAAEFVRTALGDGRIGLEEIDERLGAVLGARTRGDLEAALVHLPGADAVLAAAEPVSATRPAGEPVTITGTHARMQRSGRWDVPTHLVVTLVHSSLVLDLTEVVLPGPQLLIDADLTHSRLRLIVPDDVRVEATDLDEHGSKLRFEPARNDIPARAVVRVTGRLQWSRVTAVAPGRRRRRLRRRA
ncbi:DUF1707 SHOCT-like domain-containing protein [Jiangella alba]|uniref:DUF1707 domain-containing protein n=1 Tax=Jiangella alba TaxID=561176 RepID=A0A1H5MK55_9ACTN|nr:DUF1707 domain-containing protein [Jiangella alba]SEE89696.1 protein of unknown function [Jiangella alba]